MVLHAEVDRDMPYLGTGRKMSKSVHIAGRVLGYGWERRSRSKKRTKVPWYISTYDVGGPGTIVNTADTDAFFSILLLPPKKGSRSLVLLPPAGSRSIPCLHVETIWREDDVDVHVEDCFGGKTATRTYDVCNTHASSVRRRRCFRHLRQG